MIERRFDCPDASSLKRLVTGTVDRPGEQTLLDHIDECSRCQRRLDRAVSAERFSQEVAARLNQAEDLPAALQKLIRDAEHDIRELSGSLHRGRRSPGHSLENVETSLDVSASDTLRGPSIRSSDFDDVLGFLDPADSSTAIARVGSYDLTEFLGRGGMGVVFRGRDPKLDRTVAVKLISPSVLSRGDSLERFNREARAVAAVNHPGIVTIHAVDDARSLPWFVMEYVDGPSLDELLRKRGRLSESETVRLGYQLAQALAAAHERGIIHRDIKPANVLIQTTTKRAKLTDFGLACIDGDTALTSTGVLVGTPAYLSPEAIDGHGTIDERSDLFSLGCVLYRCLTGRLPFESTTTFSTLQQIVSGDFDPLDEVVPDISPALTRIVTRLLHRESERRFDSAKSLASELRTLLREESSGGSRGFGEAAAPQSDSNAIATRAWRWSGHPARLLAISFAVALVAVAVFAIGRRPETTQEASQRVAGAPDESSGATEDDERPARLRQPAVTTEFRVSHPDLTKSQVFGSLESALEEAPSGSTIEINSDGPFKTGSVELGDRELTIAAKPGCEPHLIFTGEPDGEDVLFDVQERLVLKGLHLSVAPTLHDATLIAGDGESVQAANCWFVTGEESKAVFLEGLDVAAFLNCEFFSGSGEAIVCEPDETTELTCENCLFFGRIPITIELTDEPLQVSLRHCTVVGESCIHCDRTEFLSGGPELEFDTSHCLFAPFESMLAISSQEPVSRNQLARLFRWRGDQNAWRSDVSGIEVVVEPDDESDGDDERLNIVWTIDEVTMLPNVDESESSVLRVDFSRSWHQLRTRLESEDAPDSRWLIPTDSDGQRLEVGVHAETAGPGPAYQQWLSNEEAAQWPSAENE